MKGQKLKAGGKAGKAKKAATKENEEPTAATAGDDDGNLASEVMEMNRKKKKSGGFQSMGLDYPVYKGVVKKGYKVPTPIQRKTIPLILQVRVMHSFNSEFRRRFTYRQYSKFTT